MSPRILPLLLSGYLSSQLPAGAQPATPPPRLVGIISVGQEVIYALDTVLGLRGIKVVPAEGGFIKAVELPPGEW
jgi:hypothetical protein